MHHSVTCTDAHNTHARAMNAIINISNEEETATDSCVTPVAVKLIQRTSLEQPLHLIALKMCIL